jgi:mannitol/fructose-specific phosphotransferase system IIA component
MTYLSDDRPVIPAILQRDAFSSTLLGLSATAPHSLLCTKSRSTPVELLDGAEALGTNHPSSVALVLLGLIWGGGAKSKITAEMITNPNKYRLIKGFTSGLQPLAD